MNSKRTAPPSRSSKRCTSRLITMSCALLFGFADASAALVPIQISPDQHHFVTINGDPFFYLADAAWELFHRTTIDEAETYLEDRASKGFNVFHAALLAELDGVRTPNAYGNLPFVDLDPSRPNPEYFKYVDRLVNKGAELGLYPGLLPTWGDKLNRRWGAGPANFFNDETARAYGEFLAKRYQDTPVIWILGGDRNPETAALRSIWRALAEGLRAAKAPSHLITYHPMEGGNSARWFHETEWLDFNMFHSGHSRPSLPNYLTTLANAALSPAKPTLDGEARFEDHPIAWQLLRGRFEAWDARQAAYWSLLAGAAGHVFGNHNVWQFWKPGRHPVTFARSPWNQAIHQPGAAQMGYLKRFFESRPWQHLKPNPDAVTYSADGPGKILAASADDASFLFAYTPVGNTIEIKLNTLSSKKIRGFWLSPVSGTSTNIAEFSNTGESRRFVPPTSGADQDWLLLLEDPAKEFVNP